MLLTQKLCYGIYCYRIYCLENRKWDVYTISIITYFSLNSGHLDDPPTMGRISQYFMLASKRLQLDSKA